MPGLITVLTDQLDTLRTFFVAPHPIAVASSLAFVLFWARAGAPVRMGRVGAWFGLLLGLVAYPFAQIWLRNEPTRIVFDAIADNIGPESMHDVTALTGVISAVIAAYGDEIAKLLMLLVVVFVMGLRSDAPAIITAAVAPAAGYALFASDLSLTRALTSNGAGEALAYDFVQEWAWVGLQFGTAYLLAKGWIESRLPIYVLGVGIVHSAAAYTVTLAEMQWHPAIVTLILAVLSVFVFTVGASVRPVLRR